MKSLYESILDDEEKLISKINKSAHKSAHELKKDPFKLFIEQFKENKNEESLEDFFNSGIFDDFIKNVLHIDKSDLHWYVNIFTDNMCYIYLGRNINDHVFIIRYFGKLNALEVDIVKVGSYQSDKYNLKPNDYNRIFKYLRSVGFKLIKAPNRGLNQSFTTYSRQII